MSYLTHPYKSFKIMSYECSNSYENTKTITVSIKHLNHVRTVNTRHKRSWILSKVSMFKVTSCIKGVFCVILYWLYEFIGNTEITKRYSCPDCLNISIKHRFWEVQEAESESNSHNHQPKETTKGGELTVLIFSSNFFFLVLSIM